MKRHTRTGIFCVAIALLLEPRSLMLVRAQSLPSRINTQNKTILRGSRNPRIDALVSDGPVEDAMRVSGITVRFKPRHEQSEQLERLLQEQQDPSSPLYHVWLTPEEYGERFGPTSDEYAKVAGWIVSQGFQIDHDVKSRTYVSFSGTAAQVRKTFGTELHYFHVDGNKHFANVRETEIPSELESLIYGIHGLDDFREERTAKVVRTATGADGRHGLTPGDLAVIYNLTPLYRKGITGAGQTIAVVGQSGFNLQDVRDFRSIMGLPPSDPEILLVPGVKDPGLNGDLLEALLDVEYAGGAAPDASIVYLYGPSASQAAQYAIDQNLAPIVSYSYGGCEKQYSQWWGWFRNVAQQAAAQGITWVAASGDAGPAACESHLRDTAGANGTVVHLPASVPEVTGVGGTTFAEGNGKYWSSTNNSDGTSALSYIPERAWNDSVPGQSLAASGGGASAVYPRPNWQSGPGVPNDNARHVPDIAFTASWAHDPYLVIMSGDFVETGGTSAGTPFFAGALALLNQHVVSTGAQTRPGLGNINPRLYQLAQTSREVFHDITAGNNIIPCAAGTPNCTNGQYGYNAGPGYDQVTGVGSIDINNLFENWAASKSNPSSKASNVVITVEPSPVYQQAADEEGYEWYYTVQITETAGAPTRIKGFSIDDYDLSESIVDWFGTSTLLARGSLSVRLRSKDLTVPSDHVFAFSGVDDGGQRWSKQATARFLGAKAGAAISLTSNPPIVVKVGRGDPNCSADHPFYQQLILKELNGVGVRLEKFLAGGFDYTEYIASWFGSARLPALGTLQAGICWQIEKTPTTLSYEIHGVDETGQQVRATLSVDFKSLDEKSGFAQYTNGATMTSAQPALTSPPSSSAHGALVGSRMRSRPQLATRK